MTRWERFRATWIFRRARVFILLVWVTFWFPLVFVWDVKNSVRPRARLRYGYHRIWNEEV